MNTSEARKFIRMMQDGHLPPLKEHPPYVDEHDYNCAYVSAVEQTRDSFIKSIQKATAQAMAEGIKANSIVINENMVRVQDVWIRTPLGARCLPKMICGLNVYLTKDELPEGYSFAVLEGPNNRLEQFESIGMEPDELRKAAELYRRIEEVIE